VILLATYSAALGGAERALIDFATALEPDRCLACPEGALAREARRRGLRVFPLRPRPLQVRSSVPTRARAALALLEHGRELRSLAAALDPEAVVAWGMRSALAYLLPVSPSRESAPVVFGHNDLLPGRWTSRLVCRAARRADLVVVPSATVASDLERRCSLDGRLRVISPGVDVNEFPVTEPPGVPEVLVLGALVAWKRPDLALEAAARARIRVPELRLRFVGGRLPGDPDRIEQSIRLRAAAPDLAGAVDVSGTVADPRPALARAACLLHCAGREPFGIAVLEALAAGLPAIVPASGGPAEIVDDCCAVLYPPGDAGAAADALVTVLSDPARAASMGARGRARARTHFSRETAQNRFAAAVSTVKRPRSGPAEASLALVTVTHNSARELEALLTSVERHLPGTPVVVVDCASRDGTVSVARGAGSVSLVALPENAGFARGCNRGLTEVRRPVTALVNPDVELLDDSLLALAAEVVRAGRPERLMAPLVLNPDGSRQDTVHPVPGSAADLMRAVIPPAALPRPLRAQLAPWLAAAPRRVGWAVGCALVARTETLRRLGPFDERLFLYGEDLELGLRAGQHGVPTCFWPRARVLHHRAHAAAAAFGGEPFDLLARARHEAVATALGPRRAMLDDAGQAVTFASRLMLKRALGRGAERERRQLDALGRARRRQA
jgi:GT2 family glycosyltransferase/glycosyltransferase involved in cell wall biosynthesis